MREASNSMDKAAIGLSLVCVVHCLLTPLAVVMIPALGATFLEDESFHYAILYLVLPTSLVALGLGCRKHGRMEILLMGLLGLSILCLILLVGEEVIGEMGEKVSTVTGSAIIAYAHIRNFKLCRKNECSPPKESHDSST